RRRGGRWRRCWPAGRPPRRTPGRGAGRAGRGRTASPASPACLPPWPGSRPGPARPRRPPGRPRWARPRRGTLRRRGPVRSRRRAYRSVTSGPVTTAVVAVQSVLSTPEDGSVRLDIILADAAQAADGKAYLLGAGWSMTGGDGATTMAVVIFLEVP